ncbi:MAG: MBL fold metallo-hydrolase [Chloroflexota bacterium]
MSAATITLLEVDSLEVLSLVDNFYDATMTSSQIAQRVPLRPDLLTALQPRAEHGFSMLITATWDGCRESLLLDTGLTTDGVLNNLQALGIEPGPLRAIALSHGHLDHTAGLRSVLDHFGADVPVHLHPDAFLNRKIVLPNGAEVLLPPPDRAALAAQGANVIANRDPSLLLDGHVLLTGEVPRTTSFERGFPLQQAEIDGEWRPDPATNDDQALAVHVREKGLVVIAGCSHSGIVNIVRYARALTGVETLYAVIGGFHLGGQLFEGIITETIKELESVAPSVIVPTHCTGWKAIHAIAAAMPDAFIPNSVGTVYRL